MKSMELKLVVCDWMSPDCTEENLKEICGLQVCEACQQSLVTVVRTTLPNAYTLDDAKVVEWFLQGALDAPAPDRHDPYHAVWELGWLDSK